MEFKNYFDELKKIGRKTYFSRNGEEELCFSNKKFAVEIYKTVNHNLDFIISIDGVRENYQQTKALDKNQIEDIKTLLIAPLSLEIKCRKISHILLSLDGKISKISRVRHGGKKGDHLDMVFNADGVLRSNTKNFESDMLNKLLQNQIYSEICKECIDKNLRIESRIENDSTIRKGYHSSMSISISDDKGKNVQAVDEPNCSLFIYETICYEKRKKIVMVDLFEEQEFLEELRMLLISIKAF